MSNTKYYLSTALPIVKSNDYDTKLVLSGDTVYQVTGLTSNNDSVLTWIVNNPTGSTTMLGPRLNGSYNVRNVYAYVKDATNAVINIYYGTTGATTTLLSSNLTVTTSESSTTSFTTSSMNGSWLSLRIVSTSGSPNQLVVCLALYK